MDCSARFARLSFAPALAVAAAAGALAATGMAPVHQLAGSLVACAILLLLVAGQPRRRAWALGFVFGWALFAISLTWIAKAFTFQGAMPAMMGWVTVVGLSAFLALYPLLAVGLARRLTTGLVPLALCLAGLFTATEMLRGLLFTGFAWGPLGAAWLQLPGAAGLAAWVGANGLTALLWLAAGSVAALCAPAAPGRRTLLAVLPALLLTALVAPWVQAPLPAAPGGKPGGKLLLVQPDLSQAQKHADPDAGLARLLALTRAGLAAAPDVAAVVWPEAAVDYPLEEEPDLAIQLGAMLRPGQLLLTGGVGNVRDLGGQLIGATNSLYALDAGGRILLRYDKAHLVPGGEYLPLRWLAEPLGLTRVVPGALDFIPGPGRKTYDLPGLPAFAPAICYEIIFPAAIVDRQHRPRFILTISNDAWFGVSGPPQHHDQARLRAIEEGLPVVRVTPTGVSGTIDARGRPVATLPAHQPAWQAVDVPAARPATLFARIGLLAPALLAALLLGVGILAGGFNRGFNSLEKPTR